MEELLYHHSGLMLGICNDFQVLIKLGFVLFGHIAPVGESAPTLISNELDHHISCIVCTCITPVKSPRLAGVQTGDVFCVPASHSEDHFVADEEMLRRLMENGQIVIQYTTPEGILGGETQWNPDGFAWTVEGITSPDGRMLDKVARSECKDGNPYKNVSDVKGQQISESGVACLQQTTKK